VQHGVHAAHGAAHDGGVAHVAPHQPQPRVAQGLLQVVQAPAREVVEHHHLLRVVLAQELVDGGGADEACASGHEHTGAVDLHGPPDR
jgi:hypothetical protein